MRACSVVVMLVGVSCAARNPFEPRRVATLVRVESTIDVTITKKDSEGEKKTDYGILKRELFRQSRRDATTLEIECIEGQIQRISPDGIHKGHTELHGKSFLVPGAEGVGGWEHYTRLLPGTAVAEKSSWIVDRDVTAILGLTHTETASTRIVATLDAMDGAQARIVFAGGFEARDKYGGRVKVVIPEGKGELVFDTAMGRPVSLHAAAELEMVKDVVHGGAKIGEIRSKSTQWNVRISFD